MTDADAASGKAKGPTPICAIGASAGGVGALQTLFRLLPVDLGLAYVVILHLAPDQPSALREILSVCTRMPVVSVDESPALLPNCIFVIPPDRELVIEGDRVTARPFTKPRGHRAPIDMFFRSVAAGRGDGIAVVLSGAGMDGSVGLRATKEGGGVIMVQEPAEAEFPSMPQNAIATGLADVVAPLARLAERLVEVARSKEAVRSLDADSAGNDLRRIVSFLRARTGHDFSSYKRATVMRRVGRRMQVCGTDTLAAYADHLLTTPEEAKELFSDLLISVTMFFRDPRAFEALDQKAVKAVYDELRPEADEGIRVWVVGCATGEEAYAVAMLLHEEAVRRKLHPQIQVFATDLDEGALATAREGRYPRSIEADVSEARLASFFVDEGTHYRVRKELRESVLFASHSVIKEPPFMRLDLITCRNLLIYLERSLQQQLCAIFHYALKPGRFLFLGSAETADVASELFAPLDRDARIYGARPHAAHILPILPQFAAPERLAVPDTSFLDRSDRANLPAALHVAALERSAPPSVLVDDGHGILHLSPSVGRFILHSGGTISNQLPEVVRPELRLDLRLALTRALEREEQTLTHPVALVMDGGRRRVAMHVSPVANAAHMGRQALVVFLDGGSVPASEEPEEPSAAGPDEMHRLRTELRAAQAALVASRSGHEASIQDLRATNEELQSINEEYRSTAEELETSKEELQSINEELHTVNAELKSKLGSISVAHSDLQNLTVATEIGTLFLDSDLRIKMFTQPIADLFNVTRADVGRTITDFTHHLDYDGLRDDAQRVLQNLAPIETEVRSKSGQWYVVRLRPYRTVEDRIDGTVVTFINNTGRRQAEEALRLSEARLAAIFDVLPVGVGICDTEGRLVLANPEMRRFVPGGVMPSTDEARSWRWRTQDGDRQQLDPNDFPGARAMRGETVLPGIEMLYAQDSGEEIWTQVAAVPIRDDQARVTGHVSIVVDIDAQKRGTEALQASEERLRQFGEASQDVLWIRDAETAQWTYLTPAFETVYGLDRTVARVGDNLANWVELIVPEDRDHAVSFLHRVRQGEWVTFEYRIRRPVDGQVRWLRATDFPMADSAGRIVRIGGVVHDVTALKAAETALADSEARLRTLMEGMPQLVWRADADGRWTWASPQWAAYTGQTISESIGHGWLDALHPGDKEAAVKAWSRAAGDGLFQVEHRIRHAPSGHSHWFQTRGVPVRDVDGQVVEWLGTSTDIDDQVRAREGLTRSGEELERKVTERTGELMAAETALRQSEKLTAIGQLTGGIAHDFNNLVQALNTCLELIRIEIGKGRLASLDVYLERAERTTERAAALTHRMLTFARQGELAPRTINVDRMVLGMEDLLRRTVGPAMQIELRLADGQCLIRCDLSQIENTLLNLCINARDAMSEGGWLTIGTEDIMVTPEQALLHPGARPGRYVALSVRDTGSGIPAELRDRVFEPFFTTKPIGAGTGLGLSQVHGFVHQSGGFLVLDTSTEAGPGRGTTVRLMFPVHADDPDPVDKGSSSASSRTLLLVDDQRDVRELMAEMLRAGDYRVLQAEDGPAAVRLLNSGAAFDLMLTDQGMPGGMTGIQLAGMAREHRPTLPIILMSGFADLPVDHGLTILRKPFKMTTLLDVVRVLLEPAKTDATAARQVD